MKKFTGHKEPWGEFVDVKINTPDLLRKEILKKKMDTVWISGVCDPYQPLEDKYKITRECLKILIQNDWPIVIQTRSPLVIRDIDILKEAKSVKVVFSISTADDQIRKMFEPTSPPISVRINALNELHKSGIKTSAMIAPILPGAEKLINLLASIVDSIVVDRMNYNNANFIYKKYGLEECMSDEYFLIVSQQIKSDCSNLGIDCDIVF
jgi:DNA repair photolyase